jgi:hypothetical protein
MGLISNDSYNDIDTLLLKNFKYWLTDEIQDIRNI